MGRFDISLVHVQSKRCLLVVAGLVLFIDSFFLGHLILFMASTIEISQNVHTKFLHISARAGDRKVHR
jgi:hypothetical protein